MDTWNYDIRNAVVHGMRIPDKKTAFWVCKACDTYDGGGLVPVALSFTFASFLSPRLRMNLFKGVQKKKIKI
jgi:hypothetical protein